MINPKKTDQELVALANTGDSSAMEELYLRYRDWVYSLSFRLCQNRQDSKFQVISYNMNLLSEVKIYIIIATFNFFA